MAAKNNASEKALRDIIIHRMLQSPKSQPLKPSGDPAQQGDEQGDDHSRACFKITFSNGFLHYLIISFYLIFVSRR